VADRAAVFGWRLAGDHIPERQQECWVVTRESPGMVDMALYSPGAYGSPWRTYNARSYEYPGEVVYWQPLAAPCPPDDVTGEVERLRGEVARLEQRVGYLEHDRQHLEKSLYDANAERLRLRAEVARLEAKSKALRAECSDLWEVIERAKDALPRYDGLYVADVAETLEILQGALDEEPNNAS
jgi:hypothetical protein